MDECSITALVLAPRHSLPTMPSNPRWKNASKCCCKTCARKPLGFDIVSLQTASIHARRDRKAAAEAEAAKIQVQAHPQAITQAERRSEEPPHSLYAPLSSGDSGSRGPPPDHWQMLSAVTTPRPASPSIGSDNNVAETSSWQDPLDLGILSGTGGLDPLNGGRANSPPLGPGNAGSSGAPSRSPSPTGSSNDSSGNLPDRPPLTDLTLDPELSSLVPAFDELPVIRLVYLHAVLGNVFEHLPVLDSERRLQDELTIVKMCIGTLPDLPRKPARSLPTARRRLGLNIDDYIQLRSICTVCFKEYTPEQIQALTSPLCIVRGCKGKVYDETRKRVAPQALDSENDSGGTYKRVPAKLAPYAPLLKALPRFFLRKEFVQDLDKSLDDGPRHALQGSDCMLDLQDAEAYRSTKLDHARVHRADGTIADVQAFSGSRRTLRSIKYGQSFTINIDWWAYQ